MTELGVLDAVGCVIGLVYLWLELRASVWLWLLGVVMPAFYLTVYWKAGLYADFGLQVYYIAAAAYGWICWKLPRKGKADKGGERPITHCPGRVWAGVAAAALGLWGVLYLVLSHWTDSTVPASDGLTNALSIIGLWMLARKYVEQWWVWCVADAGLAALYVYKGIPFTAGLYGLYSAVAVWGYFRWKGMMETDGNGGV